MNVRIYYHHTDCGGVVYYANYLNFLEEARTEFFEARGLCIKTLAQEGVLFVVARQEIDYKLPAFYADTLNVNARLTGVSGVKIEFLSEIKNQKSQLISVAKTLLVCIDKNFKPQPIPEKVRKAFQTDEA